MDKPKKYDVIINYVNDGDKEEVNYLPVDIDEANALLKSTREHFKCPNSEVDIYIKELSNKEVLQLERWR